MDISTAITLLEQESKELDDLVVNIDRAHWQKLTPSPGWTIAYQIGHLHWTDSVALLSLEDPKAFTEMASSLSPGSVDKYAQIYAEQPQDELLASWRRGRTDLVNALRSADPSEKLLWFGPAMRPITLVTARIMETWAHGLDVHDALSIEKPATQTLAAVARIGYRTRNFSYVSRGLHAPESDIFVRLEMPDGETLEFGDSNAEQSITGTADAFCRVVTQRRNRRNVALTISGQHAETWMDIAQAFAGRPTAGPRPDERRP